VALAETIRIMADIDITIEANGGWPIEISEYGACPIE
jgi:hypothetical protein